RRKNALTGDRIQHDHGTLQEGPTNVKGLSQLHSQREYIPSNQVWQHSVNVEESSQFQPQEKSIQADTQSSQPSGVTVVGYGVDVNHLLSLLRQHIESEFSRFTGDYLPITLDVDGHTFRELLGQDPKICLNEGNVETMSVSQHH
ncbi:hypothetical protein IFM89_033427, partial [Coptis chinensis]